MTKVAVYGSLRKGFGNHGRLLGATFVGETTTVQSFSMYSLGGFPFVQLNGAEVGPVTVEIYDCNADQLRSLDQLEGYRGDGANNFYNRSEVETGLGTALIYHIEGRGGQHLVESGDWKQYCDARGNRW
jgi:gamma-glutamylaminecyclotransferase